METINCTKCGASFEIEPDDTAIHCPDCGNTDFPESALKEGFEISGFVLKKKIGSGAMGQVWLASQTSMQRYVAIKILSPSVCTKQGFIQRFQGEIKNAAKLEHPNIITAFDAGSRKGFYYLASSYINGINLEELLERDGMIKERKALEIILGIAEALNYAWNEFNLLHRDIKPSNIIIDKNGVPKLMDMGLSKCINEDPSLTYDGEIVGTPYYMSPEQAKGQAKLDLRSDIYSLGATLYHLATGRLPFNGSSSVGILTKHITEPLIPPIDKNNLISKQLNNLIIKMMEKDLKSRYQNWDEVILGVKNILEGCENVLPEIKQISAKYKKIKTRPTKENEKIAVEITKKKRKAFPYRLIFSLTSTGILIYLGYMLFKFVSERLNKDTSIIKIIELINHELNNGLGFLISWTQVNIFNNVNYFLAIPSLDIKFIILGFAIILIILFSSFWSGSKAQKEGKNVFIHFLGGILLPLIYPLFIFNIKNQRIKKNHKEIPEKSIIKYFSKLKKKGKEAASCFEFELYDDSKIYAESIIEIKKNMLILQVYSETGDSRTLRIPYSRIKTFTKL